MPTDIVRLAEQHRARLIARDEAELRRVISAYGRVYRSIVAEAELLGVDIAEMGTVTAGQIRKLERYQALLGQIQAELDKFSAWLGYELPGSARGMIDLALGDTAGMLRGYGLRGAFNNLPAAAIETLLGFLDPQGALYSRLARLGEYTARRVGDLLLEGLTKGLNPRTVARMLVREGLGLGLTDALRMTRTVNLYSYREASRANYQANSNVVKGWQWYAHLDGDVCMSCVAMHGSIHPLDEPMDDHHNGRCLAPETLVSPDAATAFASRYYDGEILTIRTASGKLLTVTPNHPILTDRGWIAANLLKHGDNVIGYSGSDWTSFGVNPNENHMPASVEDVARTAGMNILATVPTAAEDFHGDGKGSQVHVIRANSFLRGDNDAPISQPASQQSFGGGYISTDTLTRLSDFRAMERSMCLTPYSLLCYSDTAQLFLSGQIGSHQSVGFSLPARVDTRSKQPLIDDATRRSESMRDGVHAFTGQKTCANIINGHRVSGAFSFSDFLSSNQVTGAFVSQKPFSLEEIRQAFVTNMVAGGTNLYAFASSIILDSVVEISSRTFSGHVYNLQTRTGWYISNNIISHNCSMLPVLIGMDSQMQSGEDWFSKLSDAQQRKMMGPGKFEAWRAGQFEFSALSREQDDPVYGRMRTETPLKDLIAPVDD